MSFTETEKMINELRTYQLAYEANVRTLQRRPESKSLSDHLNAIAKNKTDYYTLRDNLIEQGIGISNFPSELNYLEKRN